MPPRKLLQGLSMIRIFCTANQNYLHDNLVIVCRRTSRTALCRWNPHCNSHPDQSHLDRPRRHPAYMHPVGYEHVKMLRIMAHFMVHILPTQESFYPARYLGRSCKSF